MSKHLRPLLTTVGFSIHEMGEIAGKMLVDQLNKNGELKGRKLIPSLEVRDSVKKIENQ
jgi:LacI family transcriptional regulator